MLAALITGTVVAMSVPCQRLQLDDGRRVWVQGLPRETEPGARVILEGEWQVLLTCQANAFVVSQVISPGAFSGADQGD